MKPLTLPRPERPWTRLAKELDSVLFSDAAAPIAACTEAEGPTYMRLYEESLKATSIPCINTDDR